MACSEIRENLRTNIEETRVLNRDKLLSSKRKALQDVVNIGRDVNDAEVTILANRLKSKSVVEQDLALLKISFVQNAHNIVTFLKVNGALHALVRELSSGKSNYQLLAAECCCNLALGDTKSCLVVAKAAGPYLIAMLSGCNYNLIATSVWSLGNLAGSDDKTWRVIHAQGFLGKLLLLITEHDTSSDISSQTEIQHNALSALSQLLRVGAKLLSPEEIQTIAETIANLKNSSCRALRVCEYLISCIDSAERIFIKNKVHLKCLEIINSTELNNNTIAELTACLRTIANMVADTSGTCALEVLANWELVQNLVQKIFGSPFTHLINEMGWLLGNFMNHPSTEVQSKLEMFRVNFELYAAQFSFFSG